MSDFPDIPQGTTWPETSSRQWQNLTGFASRLHNAFGPTPEGFPLDPMPSGNQRNHRRVAIVQPISPDERPYLTVRGVRYATQPPIIGIYEWDGPAFEAYPECGFDLEDYEDLVWSGQVPTLATKCLDARRRNGQWIISKSAEAADVEARLVIVTEIVGELLTTQEVVRNVSGRWEPFESPVPMRPWPLVDVAEYEDHITGLDAGGLVDEDGRIFHALKQGNLWFVFRPGDEGGAAGSVRFLIVKDTRLPLAYRPAMKPDWFYAVRVGVEVDPETEFYRPEDLVAIAKPYRLRQTPWDGGTFWLKELRVSVAYRYPGIPIRRTATRQDEPNIIELQMIWPEYATDADHRVHPGDRNETYDWIQATKLGEQETGIAGVHWEEIGPTRHWTVLPASFMGPSE